jgi:hypothetical protein
LDLYSVGLIVLAASLGLAGLYVHAASSVAEKRRRFVLGMFANLALFVLVAFIGFGPLIGILAVPAIWAMHRMARIRFCDRVGHAMVEVRWRPPILRCPDCGGPVH